MAVGKRPVCNRSDAQARRALRGRGHPVMPHDTPCEHRGDAEADSASANTPVAGARAAYRGKLLRKYLILILSLVGGALLASGAISVYFAYHEIQGRRSPDLQHEKALAAASRIEQYIRSESSSSSPTPRYPNSIASDVELRRIEFLKLLRQAPEVTDIAQLDATGREQIAVSRLGMDNVGSNKDRSPGTGISQRQARAAVVRSGVLPQETEPYMTIAHPIRRRQGTCDRCRGQSQVHLGRRLADQDRREGQGVRRRQQRLPGRRSGYRARAAQDQPVATPARQSRHRAARIRSRPAIAIDRSCRHAGSDLGRPDRAAQLERVCRATGRGSLRKAERLDPAHRIVATGRSRDLRDRRASAGARHGAARYGRSTKARERIGAGDLDQKIEVRYRRRAGGARRPIQPHDRRSCAESYARPRAQGRGTHAANSRIRSSSKRRSARSCA